MGTSQLLTSSREFHKREADLNLLYPTFDKCVEMNSSVSLSSKWRCTALLHPFRPPLEDSDSPFYELCLADIVYVENDRMSIQIKGKSERTWWYMISKGATELSRDKGKTWATARCFKDSLYSHQLSIL